MKRLFVFIAFHLSIYIPIDAQTNEKMSTIGLNLSHVKEQMPIGQNRIISKIHKVHLYLPKYEKPRINVLQNIYLSQNFYPQMPLNNNLNEHYRLINKQIIFTNNPREVLFDRIIDAAISKLFGVD